MTSRHSKLHALANWLTPPKPLFLAIGIIVVALLIAFLPATTEPKIRIAGLVLQLLGILSVIWGISETRALFGHAPWGETFRKWLKGFPFRCQSVVVAVGTATLGVVTAKGRAHATHSAGPNATIEERVDSLEQNIKRIHDRITGVERDIDGNQRKAEEAQTAERDARMAEDRALAARLEATGTGGVHISAAGALLLFIGVLLSSASVELASLMK